MSFADVTRASGIDFHLTCGGPEKRYIMESMCGGVAVFDYDNDGWMDIFLVNGSTLEDMRSGKCHPGKLYRNNHDGTFTDVSAKAGITHCGWGFGVAVGDYDNDGWEDLYITYLDGGGALPQQPRRIVHRCHRESRSRKRRTLGHQRGLWRLRQ